VSQNLKESYVLCCDWGTSSFRLRLVASQDYSIIAEFLSQSGVASIFKAWQGQKEKTRFDFYSSFLMGCIQEIAKKTSTSIQNIPLIVSGMASSTIGMEELPYAEVPFDTLGSTASIKIFENFNGKAPLLLVSGVKSPEDVMRGEEAQLIGLIKLNEIKIQDSQNSVFIFPGTHSKHIFVKNRLIHDFQTFMTGELFNIIKEYSILKDSVETDSESISKTEINAFLRGIEVSSKSSILHNLFTVRTSQLFGTFAKKDNLFYLSGLLIGTEVRQLEHKTFDNLIVCSGNNLFDYYKLAFNTIFPNENITFIKPEMIDKATIAGQIQLFYSQINSSHE
jgi:2-dehydro-3-deoxygalactonokinase